MVKLSELLCLITLKIIGLTLLFFCASTSADDVCPSTCECYGTIVDCSSNGLNQVPENIPSWVEHLNLNKNPFMLIRNDSLVGLPSLKKLDITHLQLEEIPDLGQIPTLREIHLDGNKISNLSSNWYETVPHLTTIHFIKNHYRYLDFTQLEPLRIKKIDFKSNSISKVSTDPSASLSTLVDLRLSRNQIDDEAFHNLSTLFGHMTHLKQLDLNRNLLEKPQSLMFQNLTKLQVLKLKRNKIINLPPGVFLGLTQLTTLRLDNNTNITEISNEWLFDQKSLKVLGLSHNNVEQIKENAWESTKVLAILDLSHNKLGCRHTEPNFNSLHNLKELYLSHNCFTNIDEITFQKLTVLETLDLSYNQLQLNIEYNTGAFQSLKSLDSLNLAYNKIETLHEDIFRSLSSLTTLDLSGNSIKTLPHNPFKNLGKLKHLSFNSSNLVCDCSLTWMPEFLKSLPFSTSKFTCGFPKTLSGRPIVKLKKRQLNCDNSPQPEISEFPPNQTVIYGRNMTLQCVAHVGGDKPSFTWTKNRKVVEPFHVKTYMSVEDDESTKIVSQFHIDNVTHGHAGTYQCIARNAFGPSYSLPAKVKVNRYPYFTEKPVSVEVKEGGAVEIKCAASGYPLPNIVISKIGDFPAPREKRLLYSSDRPNVYFIKPIMPRDDGIYVCTAYNDAGSINITARVSVIHTPSFSRPPQNQASTLGQSIALECQGTGQPKPKVTWYKENRLVVPDSNHILLEEGQFLLLLKVNREDIGTYLCELTNRLGTQRRKVNLTLKQEILIPAITGLIIMTIVICVVLTSFIWVIVIYHMRKKFESKNEGRTNTKKPYPETNVTSNCFDELLHNAHKDIPNGLLTPSLAFTTTPAQDSGSEHSSGKDSGVGESHQRSTEDLHREPKQRKSLLIYPDSPNSHLLKAHNNVGRAPLDDMRPRLSTFNQQQLESHRNYNPTYASLRRGSTSRLLAVPSPVTPGGTNSLGMNSLPRHAYRSHSKYSIPIQDTASLSRRKPSISRSMGGPRSVRDYRQEDDEETQRVLEPQSSPLSDSPIKIAPNFYSFRSDGEERKEGLPNGVHLLPSR